MSKERDLLRRALAHLEWCGEERYGEDLEADIRTFLAAAPEAKPVAWIQPNHLDKAQFMPFLCRVEPKQRDDFIPLYTRPEPETEEPVAWGQPDACGNIVETITPDDKTHTKAPKGWADIYSVPLYTRPEPESEPALLTKEELESIMLDWMNTPKSRNHELYVAVQKAVLKKNLIHTRPEPSRKPMTEEEIKDLYDQAGHHDFDMVVRSVVEFARAIEKQHGIGGDDGEHK